MNPAPPLPPPPPARPPAPPARPNNSVRMPNNTGGKYNRKARAILTRIKNLMNSLKTTGITQQAVNGARTQVREITNQIEETHREFVADVNNLYTRANQRIKRSNMNVKFNVHKNCITARNCPKIRDMDRILSELQSFLNNQVRTINRVKGIRRGNNQQNAIMMNTMQVVTQRKQMNRNVQNILRQLRNIQQKI